ISGPTALAARASPSKPTARNTRPRSLISPPDFTSPVMRGGASLFPFGLRPRNAGGGTRDADRLACDEIGSSFESGVPRPGDSFEPTPCLAGPSPLESGDALFQP